MINEPSTVPVEDIVFILSFSSEQY